MQSCTNIDGQLLAASCGSVVKTWNPLEDGSKYTRPVFFTNTYRIESVAWNLGGTLLAYGGDHSVVSVKDWTNRTSRTFPSDNKASLRRLGFGFDGNSLVAAGTDGCVTIWNCKNEKPIAVVNETTSEITALTTAPSANADAWHLVFATSSGDLSVYYINQFVPSLLGKLSDPTLCSKTALDSSFSPSIEQLLVASGDKRGHVTVYNAISRYAVFSQSIHKGSTTDVCFGDRSDMVFSCGVDGIVCGLDLRSSKTESITFSCPLTCMSYRVTSKTLAIGTQDGCVHLRDRRKMDISLASGQVHPEANQMAVSSVRWQTTSKKAQSKKSSKKEKAKELLPLPMMTSSPCAKSTRKDVFSPVRMDAAKVDAMTPKRAYWSRSHDAKRIDESQKDLSKSKTPSHSRHHHYTQSDPVSKGEKSLFQNTHVQDAPFENVSSHRLEKNEKDGCLENHLRSIHEQTSEKASHSKRTGNDLSDSFSRWRTNVMSSTQDVPRRPNEFSHTAFMTPQPKGARREPVSHHSVSAVSRKRIRKCGSFSDFAGNRTARAEESPKEDEKEFSEETKEYWKHQYMNLREDMFELHFQLMSELRLQKAESTKKQNEMERQLKETRKELVDLKSLVGKRLNDSIKFI